MVTCRCFISYRGTRGNEHPLPTTHTHTHTHTHRLNKTRHSSLIIIVPVHLLLNTYHVPGGSLLFTHMTHINPSPFFETGSDIYPHFTDGILFPSPSPHSWAACVSNVDSTSTLSGEGQSPSGVREEGCGGEERRWPPSPPFLHILVWDQAPSAAPPCSYPRPPVSYFGDLDALPFISTWSILSSN